MTTASPGSAKDNAGDGATGSGATGSGDQAAAAAGGHTASAPHARAAICRNCGAAVTGNYCQQCGQDTSLHPLSVWEFVHEIVSHYVAVEGKLWRTLSLLTLKPGRLTLEYLAGRRQRYIIPLRLYLTASFLFFAVAQLNGGMVHESVGADGKVAVAAKEAAAAAKPASASTDKDGVLIVSPAGLKDGSALVDTDLERCLDAAAPCSRVERLIAPGIVKLKHDPKGVAEHFVERLSHGFSYAMFFLLPIFALLLAGIYRNRTFYYGEHLVFALHVHSFWFLMALLIAVLPDAAGNWLVLAILVYGYWAMQQVYGGRWWVTMLRATTVMTAYGVVLALGTAALSLFLLATA